MMAEVVQVAASEGRRRSPFGEAVTNGRELRELENECFLERYTSTFEAHLVIVDGGFSEFEEAFRKERRAVADDPSFPPADSSHDLFMLQLRRNNLAAQMIRESNERFHKFIIKRSEKPIELPPVQDRYRAEVAALVKKWELAHG